MWHRKIFTRMPWITNNNAASMLAETGELGVEYAQEFFSFFSFIFLFSIQFPQPVFWPGDFPAFGAPLSRSSWMFFVLECWHSQELQRISFKRVDTWPDSYYIALRFNQAQFFLIHSKNSVSNYLFHCQNFRDLPRYARERIINWVVHRV